MFFFFYFLLCHGDKWRKVCVWIRTYSSTELISSLSENGTMFSVTVDGITFSQVTKTGSFYTIFIPFMIWSKNELKFTFKTGVAKVFLHSFPVRIAAYFAIVKVFLRFLSQTQLGWTMQCPVGNLRCPTQPWWRLFFLGGGGSPLLFGIFGGDYIWKSFSEKWGIFFTYLCQKLY